MKTGLACITFIFVLLFFSCGENPVENPNGMSEMSALMETISNRFFTCREALLQNKSGLLDTSNYAKIYTAKTTKQNVIDTRFKNYAEGFLASVAVYLQSDEGDKIKYFNRMITGCRNCHQDVCPGPIERIRKLFIPEKN